VTSKTARFSSLQMQCFWVWGGGVWNRRVGRFFTGGVQGVSDQGNSKPQTPAGKQDVKQERQKKHAIKRCV